ncbi:5-formyltetrahydrofolate cyclo-ligase [Cloacibacterium rupense]|uniref:5-formyltetrahydrofolate cyclo-ligase n=1 Tax=Cloacibacterium rupense TaxID=517423 RepID=A0ABQ2NIF1_9FLAO|nr:5-formyltetrahydrofolate cyclo-ligase [Cloacibacterium rupense]GGP03006.1 5-formyltetrahydrofolate cyclo-ligase [Cloacibacterium rupense]
MLKKELRQKYLEKRKTLSEDEVNFLSQKILKNFILQFNLSENQSIHVFMPIKKFNEIETNSLIEYFWKCKVNVFLPKIHENKIISIKYTSETILQENAWGILEPVSIINEENSFDYVITPLLYCDNNGNRVGYGKGFYDEFFRTINADAKKIGVNYFPPIDIIDDVSENDVKLDYLVTPDEILSFSDTSIFTK